MDKRTCPFCGKPVGASLNRCPFCRESLPPVSVGSAQRSAPPEGRANIRRGLLWALLAGVLYYFASGRSGLTLPVEIPSFVNQILTPLLFLAGVAMALYGLFQKMRS